MNEVHYEPRRPEETTLYRSIRERLEGFSAQVETRNGASLPEFVKHECDVLSGSSSVADGFPSLSPYLR